MPNARYMDQHVENNGCRLAYAVDGPSHAPALLLSNSLGTTREFWAGQVEAFSTRFRVIRYDTRGHGQSSSPAGDYTIEQLGADALAILDAERIASAHVCGLSLGALTAMWLAVHAQARVSRLVLANTSARIGSVESWTDRISLVRREGMHAVADRAAAIWFSKDFQQNDAETVNRYVNTVRTFLPAGYIGCCTALRDTDLRPAIRAIRAPTLAIGSTMDTATSPEVMEGLCSQIPGARLLLLKAAHFSNIEDAAGFNEAVLDFLAA
jgi:3-oxoadipate enol-lactonase